ncbi:hypothetical protein ACFFMN_23010 [Planobispora siamensis]|uniref:Uncharacterized protein n=1 Tax=Planobispora siamensis TaxID=936338 RepID=A0A8J3SJB1_9ACTN|nr:hypothetical protein [Planobispora siamensis]GIH95438.1 hypothetical protein Psi01_60680 [Planobispora siamensis]
MDVRRLARADPIPRVITHLSEHPEVTAALGGPGRVGLDNVPPYPRLRITDPPGDDRDLIKLVIATVQVEAYGDLDGTIGKGALKDLCYIAIAAIKELPLLPVPPGQAVITEVLGGVGVGWAPEPTGQGRYVGSCRVYCHASRHA